MSTSDDWDGTHVAEPDVMERLAELVQWDMDECLLHWWWWAYHRGAEAYFAIKARDAG